MLINVQKDKYKLKDLCIERKQIEDGEIYLVELGKDRFEDRDNIGFMSEMFYP
jgi:hypothetical protein